jgi:hypothetical protein
MPIDIKYTQCKEIIYEYEGIIWNDNYYIEKKKFIR